MAVSTALILAANRALWGEITPNIRYVKIAEDRDRISIKFIFDGAISEDDIENVNSVETDIMADFPNHQVFSFYIRNDFPNRVEPEEKWIIVYHRKEY